jgi:hypothetical protein
MKATTCIQTTILSAIFVLQFSTIFANSDGTSVSLKKEYSISVAPTTPKEATFEDVPEMNTTMINLSGLAPVTPMEATFEDDPVVDLTPVAPAEVDFNELD